MPDNSLVPVGDGVEITSLGLVVSGEMEIESWLDLGYTLAGLRRAFTWAIGDWLNYGEFRYGEKYAQGEAVTGMNPDYLRNLKWVASRIPLSLRRDNRGLSWHQPVASLESDEEKEYWLMLADTQDWTRAELRARINGSQLPQTSPQTRQISPLSDFEVRVLVIAYIKAMRAKNRELEASTFQILCDALKDEL